MYNLRYNLKNMIIKMNKEIRDIIMAGYLDLSLFQKSTF